MPDTRRAAAIAILILFCVCAQRVGRSQDCNGNLEPDAEEVAIELRLGEPILIRVGDEPTDLVAADLDGDGRVDLALTATKSNAVIVLRNTGGAGVDLFAIDASLCVGVDPRGLGIDDVDGDGALDLVCGAENRSDDPPERRRARSILLRGDGVGRFAPACAPPCDGAGEPRCTAGDFEALRRPADAIRSLRVVDLDGDGDADIVNGFRDIAGIASALFNDGSGSFVGPFELNATPLAESRYLEVGDVDGDGDVDIVTAGGEWLPGPFSPDEFEAVSPQPLTEPSGQPKGIALADVDSDGVDELLIARTGIAIQGLGGGELVVLRRADDGWVVIDQPGLELLCDLQEAVVASDLDGDGDADVVVTHVGDPLGGACGRQGVSCLVNDGAGAFTIGPFVPLVGLPRALSAADFDGDGRPDIAVALHEPGRPDDSIAVLLNRTEPSPADVDGDGVPDDCEFLRGDVDRDGEHTISDPIAILQYLFRGGAPLACLEGADADDDGRVVLSDAVYLLDYLFRGGASLPPPNVDPCAPTFEWEDPSGMLPCEYGCS